MAKSKKQSAGDKAASRTKKAIKKAEKALAKAKKAVAAAQKAAEKSGKKLRPRVVPLIEQAANLSSTLTAAARKRGASTPEAAPASAETDGRSAAAQSPPAEPVMVVTAVPSQPSPSPAPAPAEEADLTPPLPSPRPASPTLVELRRQARERKIPGYSRLNKADLIAALEATPPAG